MHRQQDRAQASSFPSGGQVDRAILNLLLREPGLALWAIDEIVREIGSRVAVDDWLWRFERRRGRLIMP